MPKKKLLLHVCCGPCSTQCVNELMKDYDITMYFYNPNIHPGGEYARRLEAANTVSSKFSVPIKEGNYEPDEWVNLIQGFEMEKEGGKRCKICFAMRLSKAAEYAKENKFDAFTTTLSISPHKDSKIINELGKELSEKYKIEWLHSDFKENDGFKKSVELSKEMGIYRQKYCGCFYSIDINAAR